MLVPLWTETPTASIRRQLSRNGGCRIGADVRYNALNYLEYLRGIWYLGDIPTETMYPKSDEPGDIHMLHQWTVNSETELTMYYFNTATSASTANTVIERVSRQSEQKR